MTGRVGDFDLLELGQLREGELVLKAGSKSGAEQVGTQPAQVVNGETDAAVGDGGEQGFKVTLGIRPLRAVDEQHVYDAVEALIKGGGKTVLPPAGKRKVGIEVRKDDVAHLVHIASFQQERNLLTADGFVTILKLT